MNKQDLIEAVSKVVCTKKEAAQAVETMISEIKNALEKNEKVTLAGLGSFSVTTRKARTGRNPRTGETIQIPAKKVVRFRPSKQAI